EILRGDKIALIGANGKGKSTLLRIIGGIEQFDGERIWGHNVEESFYAQHQLESLDLNNTILEELKLAGSQHTEQELRTLLGCFLFSGDDVDKKIRVLSGGEKARVALAKTIISKSNFLMLDEPTNHLDMHSCDLLIEALNKYQGSLILVSHDRHFISKTANKIWEIADNKIVEFPGTYEEWVAWRERMEAREADKNIREEKHEAKIEEKPVKVSNAPVSKELKKEIQRYQKRFQQLETDINRLKQEKEKLEISLSDPEVYSNKEKFLQTEKAYKQKEEELNRLNREYEEVFEKLMELES